MNARRWDRIKPPRHATRHPDQQREHAGETFSEEYVRKATCAMVVIPVVEPVALALAESPVRS